MLYDKQGSGVSTLTINNLTFEDAKVSVSGDYAAVIMGYADSVVALTFNNVTIKGATVSSGKYAGAFVGYAAGYSNVGDGPVYQHVTFNNCAVIDSQLTGVGSVGALMGHASGSTDSKVVVTDTTVTGNTITCIGEGKTNLAGALFGTVGNLGPVNKPDAGIYVTATVSGNTVKSDGTTITTIYGRQGSENGTLIMTAGGSYDAPPIAETDSAWAFCIEDYEVTESNGIYSVTKMPPVAKIDDTTYTSLQKALNAAHEMTGDVTVELVADITEVAVIHQKAGLNLTLDGAEKTITGQIYIDGDGRYNDADVLTIQNVKFAYNASTYDDGFIVVPSTKTAGKPYTTGKYNYAHNVTVSNCEFAGSGETTVAFRVASGAGANGVELDSLKVTGGHSFAQLTGVKDLTITGCTITGTKNGINISGGEGTGTISGTTLTTTGGYTVRLKDESEMSVTLVDNTFNGAEGIISSAMSVGKITVNSGSYVGALDSSAGKLVITGGRFSVEVPESYCGKDAEDNELYPIAGLYPDTPETPNGVGPDTVAVAIVTQGDPATTTRYVSLAAAVAAANTGDTVKLLVDTTIESITVDKKIILDLNEKTVSSDGVDLFYVTSNGDLTIAGNGKVNGPANGQNFDGKALISVDGGKLTIENGTFTANGSGSDGMYGVYVYNGGTAVFGTAASGETPAIGPEITSHFAAIGTNNTTAPAKIVVNGGTYTANAAPTSNDWWSYFCAPVYAAAAGDFTLNGGTFNGYYGISSRYVNVDQDVKLGNVTIVATSGTQVFVDEKTGSAGLSDRVVLSSSNERSIPEGYTWVATENEGEWELKKLYTITFVDEKGETIKTADLAKDTTAEKVAETVKKEDVTLPAGATGYSWTPAIEAVSSNATYTVNYVFGNGFVYPVGNGGVLIKTDWIQSNVNLDVSGVQPGSTEYTDAVDVLSKPVAGGNVPLWQCYVLGLDPAKPQKLVIDSAAVDGSNYAILGAFKPVKAAGDDAWTLKTGTENAVDGYTVNANYRVVYRDAEGKWQYASDEKIPVTTGENGTAPLFTQVNMNDVAFKTLAIVIDVTVDTATPAQGDDNP